MSKRPINLVILWHQHQPFYQDLESGKATMPWVRLHAVKDYYDMAARIPQHEGVKLTINLVPTLLEQIDRYVEGTATDIHLEVSRKPVEELSEWDKRFLWEHFFECHHERMVLPHPRYRQLFQNRPRDWETASLDRWRSEDWRDLQTWHNLSWCDPWFAKKPGIVRDLLAKEGHFTEQEKQTLLDFHIDIMREIIPLHRRLQDEGHIEISTTPYAHPILPILVDARSTLEAMPGCPLPQPPLETADDARKHVQKAVEMYENWFGCKPRGMWPAEGSVSQAVVDLFAEAELQWIASDEGILARSLQLSVRRDTGGHLIDPLPFVQPYALSDSTERRLPLSILFRDREISDRIGFQYQTWDPDQAAHDILHRIQRAGEATKHFHSAPLVCIILDGENCWENYPNDGGDFLSSLYGSLAHDSDIRTVLPCEYLKKHPPTQQISKLAAGSWINSNFHIWIGHPDDRTGWERLGETRRELIRAESAGNIPPAQIERAWHHLYLAEGSDWFWWYGDDHHSDHDALFDQAFRDNLMSVYRNINQEIPPVLYQPIGTTPVKTGLLFPKTIISPMITGTLSHFYEWHAAGGVRASDGGGAMHYHSAHFAGVYYGGDREALYLRVDSMPATRINDVVDAVTVSVLFPHKQQIQLTQHNTTDFVYKPSSAKSKTNEPTPYGKAVDFLEIAIPWKYLGNPGDQISFRVELLFDNELVDTQPAADLFRISVPDESWMAQWWVI